MTIAFIAVALSMDENEAYLLIYSRDGYLVGSVVGSWDTELRRSLVIGCIIPLSRVYGEVDKISSSYPPQGNLNDAMPGCSQVREKRTTSIWKCKGQLSGGRCLKNILYHSGGKVGVWGGGWLAWEMLIFQAGGRSSVYYSCCFDSPIVIT